MVQPAELTSVTFFLNNPSAGEDISVSIYSVTDTPVNLLGTSIVVPVPVAGPQTITLPIAGGPLQLPAGDFALLVEEGDSNITLGTPTTSSPLELHGSISQEVLLAGGTMKISDFL